MKKTKMIHGIEHIHVGYSGVWIKNFVPLDALCDAINKDDNGWLKCVNVSGSEIHYLTANEVKRRRNVQKWIKNNPQEFV